MGISLCVEQGIMYLGSNYKFVRRARNHVVRKQLYVHMWRVMNTKLVEVKYVLSGVIEQCYVAMYLI